MNSKLEKLLDQHAERLHEIDQAIIMDSVGMAMAADHLRKALDKLDQLIDERKYEEAAALGYDEIASEFIFLQRTMGAIPTTLGGFHNFVGDMVVAGGGTSYEAVAPDVKARMECWKSREQIAKENGEPWPLTEAYLEQRRQEFKERLRSRFPVADPPEA